MKNTYLKTKKTVIVLHEGLPVGPSHDLRKFLLDNSVGTLLFITHPLTYVKDYYKESSKYTYYQDGRFVRDKKAFHWRLPDVFLYCKDFIYSIVWCFGQNEKYDVFFGVDPLNALAGIVLRRLGRVDKVVYYTIDYFSQRFSNKIVNKLYHMIDKISVRFADETWNLSPVMIQAREKFNNMNREIYDKQKTVPVGVWFYEIKRKPLNEIDKNKIIFIGHLAAYMGVDLILKAVPIIIKKIPTLKLEIVGGGDMEQSLKDLAKDLQIINNVKFYGWIHERKKIDEILSDGAVGLAPFNTTLLHDEIKNADPAKLKDYMAFGMPVIVTNAVSNVKQLEAFKCCIVIDYDVQALANAVIKFLQNEKLLKEYRNNALTYAQQFDYYNIYSKNLSRLFSK